MDDVLLSVGLGASIGLLYGAASLVTARLALRQPGQRFMLVFLGGMMARLGLAIVLVLLVLLLFEVQVRAFIGTLLVVFLLGLAAEVWFVHRRRPGGTESA